MYTAAQPGHGPFVIRYPRGRGSLSEWRCPLETVPVGTGRRLKAGTDLAVITLGPIGHTAAQAIARTEADTGCSIAHYDLRFLKPIDEELLHEAGRHYRHIVTIEDGALQGGMGSAVLEFMSDHGYPVTLHRLGVPDRFIPHGPVADLHALCGIDLDSICSTLRKILTDV